MNKQHKSFIPVVLGLDVSTSCVGVCVLHAETGNYISLFPIKLDPKTSFYEKISCVLQNLNIVVGPRTNYTVENIYVEEPLQRFTPGRSSIKTIILLAQFNAIICYELRKMFIVDPILINVRTARKNLDIKIDYKSTTPTKQQVFEEIKSRYPFFPWVHHVAKSGKNKGSIVYHRNNYDLADSYVVAAAGMKINEDR